MRLRLRRRTAHGARPTAAGRAALRSHQQRQPLSAHAGSGHVSEHLVEADLPSIGGPPGSIGRAPAASAPPPVVVAMTQGRKTPRCGRSRSHPATAGGTLVERAQRGELLEVPPPETKTPDHHPRGSPARRRRWRVEALWSTVRWRCGQGPRWSITRRPPAMSLVDSGIGISRCA